MSAEPARRTFRLPTRSAISVRKVPRKTSPSNVKVKKRPIWESWKERAEKKIAVPFTSLVSIMVFCYGCCIVEAKQDKT